MNEPHPCKRGPAPKSQEERDVELEKEEAILNSKKYCLVQQGRYHGCYCEESGNQVLFHSRAEAIEYLHQLLHGKDSFRAFYGNKYKAEIA